jgi:hypothetical protein
MVHGRGLGSAYISYASRAGEGQYQAAYLHQRVGIALKPPAAAVSVRRAATHLPVGREGGGRVTNAGISPRVVIVELMRAELDQARDAHDPLTRRLALQRFGLLVGQGGGRGGGGDHTDDGDDDDHDDD